MSPIILSNVKENLEKSSKINQKRIDKLINNMKFWKKDKIIYPNHIKSLLLISSLEAYEILDILVDMKILIECYEIYCSKCEKFMDKGFLESLNQFPSNLYCEDGHKLEAFNDTVLVYKVILDE